MRELIPTFGQSMYSAYLGQSTGGPKSLVTRVKGVPNRVLAKISATGSSAPEPQDAPDLQTSMQLDLTDAFSELQIGPSDRLLFHTADGATYKALAELLEEREIIDLPLIHVCTPYDPEGVMPNRENPEQVKSAIDLLRASSLLNRRVFLHGENPFLAKHLSQIWDSPVLSLDLPAYPIDEAMKYGARKFRESRLLAEKEQFLVVSLGAARLEKGFHLIPDIVRRTFEFAGTEEFSDVPRSKIKFVLHASAQIVGRHPLIAKSIEKLEAYSKDQVQLLKEPLSDLDYRSLTLASDSILMPYDEAAYRVRGSGVVAEAIVARKFIVAKTGSYPAEMALWQGGACGETPALMAKALLTIVKDRWQRFERVKQTSFEYIADNSVDQYMRKVIAAERSSARVIGD
ncbi:MAG: hypothetical protein AAFZ91_14815 [Pseudomonadota bacterium]